MASPVTFIKILPFLALALALPVKAAPGDIFCQELDREDCAFAVSATGQRCVLEKSVHRSGLEKYSCKASFIYASESLKNWIESRHCVDSCGLDRTALGISSDALMKRSFAQMLCAPHCYDACPNVVDLFSNLAAGEGVSLAKFCAAQSSGGLRRGLAEFRSSSLAAELAEGPESDGRLAATKVGRKLAETDEGDEEPPAEAPSDSDDFSSKLWSKMDDGSLIDAPAQGLVPAEEPIDDQSP